MITQEQLKEVIERRDALHHYLDIDTKKYKWRRKNSAHMCQTFGTTKNGRGPNAQNKKNCGTGLTILKLCQNRSKNYSWLLIL